MPANPFIFDAHLDLSMNALEWNRDLRLPIRDLREAEEGMTDKPDRGKGTVSFPALREGKVRICVATQIARYVKKGNSLPGWNSPEQAWAHTQGQLAWYRSMEECGEMVQIRNLKELNKHLARIENDADPIPLGYILSLEGADSILSMKHLEKAWEQGLRAIGPAHFGPGTHAQGTGASGGFTGKGKQLIKEMEHLNIILDMTHLSEESFYEALDAFGGAVWASHNNCRKFAPHSRQFSDGQVKELIRRDAVIGVVLDAWMLVPDWINGVSTPENRQVTLRNVVDNIDHICQLSGNSLHAGIGSDLDGAFGTEQGPVDLDTIADLQKIIEILKVRGYSEQDISNIMHGNFIGFLQKTWTE
jgi:membrane dipeptidase